MKIEEYKHVQFNNRQNQGIQFDIVDIQELQSKIIADHSIREYHRVNFFLLGYIEDGEGVHTIDFVDYNCTKGSIFTIRKDQVHKFTDPQKLKGKLLVFTDNFLVGYLQEREARWSMLLFNEQLGVPKLQLNDIEQIEINECLARLQNEYFNVNDRYSSNILRSELHILITKLFRLKEKRDHLRPEKKYLKEFITLQSLIEKNVDKNSRVSYYADLMRVSTKTLNTVTKTIINKSAKAFIDEICIKHIKRLLSNTELSIKEVAYASGFEEATNFYKYFKRHTNTTPEGFRNLK